MQPVGDLASKGKLTWTKSLAVEFKNMQKVRGELIIMCEYKIQKFKNTVIAVVVVGALFIYFFFLFILELKVVRSCSWNAFLWWVILVP